MARRKDLLSEAIADAKAVKETALANAKLALEEAFTPKLQSMISAKLAEDADEEMEEELDSSDLGAGDNAQPSDDANDSSDIENDDELMVAEEDELEEDEVEEDDDMEDDMEADLDTDSEEEMGADMDDDMEDDDEDELDLESVIAELEAEMEEDEAPADENYHEEEMDEEEDMDEEEEIDLDEVIKTLKEMEEGDYTEEEMDEEEDMDEDEDLAGELEEAYNTIASLKNTINEVNLLNAKLLYTNKLFRTFDLNENQKVKVLENFDRTSSVREVKLVFSTLAENLNVAKKKRTVVKEGYASKATKSSAPKKIISEGNEMAARWKKLAGLK